MLDHSRELYLVAIAEGFPDLTVDTFEYLSEGKDSVAWVVNRHLLFRFPKQELAEQKLLMEMRLLPELAPTLPLAIPQFTSISRTPTASYPHAFAGYGLLDGTPLHAYTPISGMPPGGSRSSVISSQHCIGFRSDGRRNWVCRRTQRAPGARTTKPCTLRCAKRYIR